MESLIVELTMTSLSRFVCRAAGPRRAQRGVVLFIALIVMVALSLAAVALVRSIDTTNAVIGNLGFRMSSILPANLAVESATAALFPDADPGGVVHIPDPTVDVPAQNYFASRQAGEDPRGVPVVLQKASTAATLAKALPPVDAGSAGQATTVRYVIERMCVNPGPVTPANCNRLPPKGITGDTANDPALNPPPTPYYRVTVRVDGPQNTASFLQAMLRPN
jgi:type IV pilus assembly protein PilX